MNEAAGYLGYYTRMHLPEVFDLVDCDGAWPAFWLYYQSKGRTLRLIEEKPTGQEIHASQRRVYGALGSLLKLGVDRGAFSERSGIYVIYEAERLVAPEFPVRMERRWPTRTRPRTLERDDFDAWLLLAELPDLRAVA